MIFLYGLILGMQQVNQSHGTWFIMMSSWCIALHQGKIAEMQKGEENISSTYSLSYSLTGKGASSHC